MKNFLTTIIVLVAGCLSALCGNDGLRIVTGNGNSFLFALDKQPELTFSGNSLTVTVPGADPVSFTFDEISHFDFAEASSVDADTIIPDIVWNAGTLTLNGLGDNAEVRIFDAAGRIVVNTKASGSFSLGRNSLPRGIYILTTSGFSTKFKF